MSPNEILDGALDKLSRHKKKDIRVEGGREGRLKESEDKTMKNRQIDKKSTKQVRIDSSMHRLLKIKAAKSNVTIKQLLEEYLAELLAVDVNEKNGELENIL